MTGIIHDFVYLGVHFFGGTPSIIQLDKVTSPALFMGSLPQQTLSLPVDPAAPQPAIDSYT